MISTVTLNPSLDRTLEVPSLIRGSTTRSTSFRIDAGGKGINVSKALALFGYPTACIYPAGGDEGSQITRILSNFQILQQVVQITGSNRVNISVVEPDGTVTKINEPGPALSKREIDNLLVESVAAATMGGYLVASGSLPLGVESSIYGLLIDSIRELNVKVVVDSSGDALRAAVRSKPHLIKPNIEELQELCGRRFTTFGEVIKAAKAIVADGVESILVSLGQDGAIYIDAKEVVHGEVKVKEVKSSVGAGDCLLAGFLAEEGDIAERLSRALKWAGATISLPGSLMAGPSDVVDTKVTINSTIEENRVICGSVDAIRV
ncbi:MAG: 1-phosphofructokinase [Actinomycetota bacterium]|nr:1-phosphofructokinase [Actinomycetota bacterium]